MLESSSSVGPELLDHLDPFRFKVAPARRRKLQLGPGREDDLAFPPGLGVDDKREAPPTMPPEKRFKPTVMVCVPVRDDERAQVFDRDLQDIQVAAKCRRRQTAVVEDRTPTAVRLDCDQGREAMLRDQLVTVAEVGGEVPADAVGAGHQHVNEVIDDDRDLSTNDRLQPNRPIRCDSHRLLTLQSWRPMDEEAPPGHGTFLNTGATEVLGPWGDNDRSTSGLDTRRCQSVMTKRSHAFAVPPTSTTMTAAANR